MSTINEQTFICEYDKTESSVCAGEIFYKELNGQKYCIFHYPSEDKKDDFDRALDKRLNAKDFNFRGFWFPDIFLLNEYEFDSKANFNHTIFNKDVSLTNCIFTESEFLRAQFKGKADFTGSIFRTTSDFSFTTFDQNTQFNGTNFEGVTHFYEAIFNSITSFNESVFYERADFSKAYFNAEMNFTHTCFIKTADFNQVSVKDQVKFIGGESKQIFQLDLNLQHARTASSDCIYFHSVKLAPAWFINIDSTGFVFINIEWQNTKEQAIEFRRNYYSKPNASYASVIHMLAIAYRQLAINAEKNHRYEEASGFRYRSMDLQRHSKWNGYAFWGLNWWYWIASGYGERTIRAFIILCVIWIVFAWAYTRVGFNQSDGVNLKNATSQIDVIGKPLEFPRALSYSLAVMSLQKPLPYPSTNLAHSLIALEAILGPLQGALFALAIRRKFMN
jgi:uncharacterized protein YjbI with pentapeptide repeats